MLAGHALPLYDTVFVVTVLHPVIVLDGAVYLHAVFAVALAAGLVVYVPPLGLTPLKLLHAAHVGLALLFAVIYLPVVVVTV